MPCYRERERRKKERGRMKTKQKKKLAVYYLLFLLKKIFLLLEKPTPSQTTIRKRDQFIYFIYFLCFNSIKRRISHTLTHKFTSIPLKPTIIALYKLEFFFFFCFFTFIFIHKTQDEPDSYGAYFNCINKTSNQSCLCNIYITCQKIPLQHPKSRV
jgi:hypothetical protein